MTNVVRPLPQRFQAVLNHRLALAVEARRRLVENEDLGVGQNRARDGDALTLSARQAHAALADDGVVPLLERLDELVAVRDAADGFDFFARRRAASRTRCSRRWCRRTGSCPAARRRGARDSRAACTSLMSMPSTSSLPENGRLNAMTRLMSVLLPEPLDPTSAVVDPAGDENETCFSTGHAGVVLERHVLELDFAADVRQRHDGRRLPDPRSPSS